MIDPIEIPAIPFPDSARSGHTRSNVPRWGLPECIRRKHCRVKGIWLWQPACKQENAEDRTQLQILLPDDRLQAFLSRNSQKLSHWQRWSFSLLSISCLWLNWQYPSLKPWASGNLSMSYLPLFLWGFAPLQVPPATSDALAFISFSAKGATVDLAERRSVAIQNVDGAVFVQTDKPLYKPGQTGGWRDWVS